MGKVLSIFIDESGDFGDYDYKSPFYVLTLVLHDQSLKFDDLLYKLNAQFNRLGYKTQNIHVGPIIRKEEIFLNEEIDIRRKLISEMMYFVERIPISLMTFVFDKKQWNREKLIKRMYKEIELFIMNNYYYFSQYDKIIIYYDNGQNEISRIIRETFVRIFHFNCYIKKVIPKDYILFQMADLVCSLELVCLKIKRKSMSNSEKSIFRNEANFMKNFYKILMKKRMK